MIFVFQIRIQNLLKHLRWLKAVNYFRKTLHLKMFGRVPDTLPMYSFEFLAILRTLLSIREHCQKVMSIAIGGVFFATHLLLNVLRMKLTALTNFGKEFIKNI